MSMTPRAGSQRRPSVVPESRTAAEPDNTAHCMVMHTVQHTVSHLRLSLSTACSHPTEIEPGCDDGLSANVIACRSRVIACAEIDGTASR